MAEQNVKTTNLIQSVDRALVLLEALSGLTDGISLMNLSEKTGMNVSTCHHLLSTLVSRGYVSQDPHSKYYFLGNRILELQVGRTEQIDLVSEAKPILRELNLTTQEAVHLAVMEADELVTLAKLEALHAVRVDQGFVGKSNSAHATATGKAILACMAESELDRFFSRKALLRFTAQTVTDETKLRQELNRVRELGYAVDNEEFQPGVYCVGAPVRNHRGEVVASVSCSIPVMRLGHVQLIEPTIAASTRLSARLGYKRQ